jgi:hypothetical protein
VSRNCAIAKESVRRWPRRMRTVAASSCAKSPHQSPQPLELPREIALRALELEPLVAHAEGA